MKLYNGEIQGFSATENFAFLDRMHLSGLACDLIFIFKKSWLDTCNLTYFSNIFKYAKRYHNKRKLKQTTLDILISTH